MSETISRHPDRAERSETAVARDLDDMRLLGIRRTLERMNERKPGLALYELLRSVERQWHIAGLAYRMHPAACPCGTRCQDGAS